MLHLIDYAGDVLHEAANFLLLRLAINRKHRVLFLRSRNHVAHRSDREVDSLQAASNRNFYAPGVISQEVEHLVLILREGALVEVLTGGRLPISELLEQIVDLKRLANVPLKAVFLKAARNSIGRDAREEVTVPSFANLGEIDRIFFFLFLTQLVVREELKLHDEDAEDVEHTILQVADLQTEVHP